MSVARIADSNFNLQEIAGRYQRTFACTQAYYVAHKDDAPSVSPFPPGCFIVVMDDTQSVMDGFIDQMYPVGTVYMNALVNTDPNTLFHTGTWVRITGKFLYGADDTVISVLDTGGTGTVTLTQNNLPVSATFTIPALSLSIDETSTAHIHTTTQTTGTTGNVSGTSTTWEHNHPQNAPAANGTIAQMVTWGGSGANGSAPNYEQRSDENPVYTSTTNLQHTHGFTIPALTTGGMSANETHTHTGSTVASFETISDFGSGTAFDIIPPYQAVAIWYRVA